MRLKTASLLALVSIAVTLSAQIQKKGPDQSSDLLTASRFINTEELNLKIEKGGYGKLRDIVAYAQSRGHAVPAALFGTSPKLQASLVLSSDGNHYQFRVTQTDCAAAFSDESGLIFLGTALGCEEFGGSVPKPR